MNFVLPVRKGGLGNQMFQVAAAIVYAEETGRQVLLPDEFYNSHNTSNNRYETTLFQSFPYRISRPIDGTAIQQLCRNGFTQHPGEPGFDAWGPVDLSGNILLHGYFQYYPPIGRHEHCIRNIYLHGLSCIPFAISSSRTRIGLHVRRGDYLKPPHCDVLPAQPLSYYQTALTYFQEPETEIYIFSDDIDWCKQQTYFQELPKKIFVNETDEVRTLAIMASCKGGFICANSTFSWWGAFLGAYEARKPVIVPRQWVKGQEVHQLHPPEWIAL